MHIHLDAIGGIAGDMFVAAMLDAIPDVRADVEAALSAVELPASVTWELVAHDDGTFTGSRFVVSDSLDGGDDGLTAAGAAIDGAAHEHGAHEHGAQEDHQHREFRAIRRMLEAAPLDNAVCEAAVAIFSLLAEAEGRVHGVAADEVTFHEVGAWDSIADIVAAAAAIASSGATSWSISPLPLGSGRVRTAHGIMPVPAPATALLMDGRAVIDDGVAGERVTPTGAAIVAHLTPSQRRPHEPMVMGATGHGFGTKVFESLPNMLRVLCSAPVSTATTGSGTTSDVVGVIEFEIDDQTPEDLAVGLDRLRATEGVLDVAMATMLAKKGRISNHVRVLTAAAALRAVIDACFRETTTIGVRHGLQQRTILDRTVSDVDDAYGSARVKVVNRPGGQTLKVDIDDLAGAADHRSREELRHVIEQQVASSTGPGE